MRAEKQAAFANRSFCETEPCWQKPKSFISNGLRHVNPHGTTLARLNLGKQPGLGKLTETTGNLETDRMERSWRLPFFSFFASLRLPFTSLIQRPRPHREREQ